MKIPGDNNSTLLQQFRGDESKKLKDFLSLSLLSICGLGILFFALRGDTTASQVDYIPSQPITQYEPTPPVVINEQPKKQKPAIHIQGVRESNEQLAFKLNRFDPNGIYIISFGDGSSRRFDGQVLHHTYTTQGIYKLTAKVKYKDQEEIIWRKTIRIDEGIEIDISAFKET